MTIQKVESAKRGAAQFLTDAQESRHYVPSE